MLGRLIAILTFSRRADCLTGPAKVIDGDTIVVADQLVSCLGLARIITAAADSSHP